MRKFLLLSLIVLLLVCALSLSACVADKSRTTYCYDYKGLFSPAEIEQIDAACSEATAKYGVTLLVATTDRKSGRAAMNGLELLAREGLSSDDDYIVLIINAEAYGKDYHFDLYKYGRAVRRFSDSEAETAVWSIYADRILTSDSATATSGVVEMMPMIGRAYDGIPLWGNVVIGLVIGLVVAGIIVARISRGYGRKRKNVIYPLDKYCQMALKEDEDKFQRSVTTFVVVNSGSSGGGHSGGGHSSGGGGGGGHCGGR